MFGKKTYHFGRMAMPIISIGITLSLLAYVLSLIEVSDNSLIVGLLVPILFCYILLSVLFSLYDIFRALLQHGIYPQSLPEIWAAAGGMIGGAIPVFWLSLTRDQYFSSPANPPTGELLAFSLVIFPLHMLFAIFSGIAFGALLGFLHARIGTKLSLIMSLLCGALMVLLYWPFITMVLHTQAGSVIFNLLVRTFLYITGSGSN